MSDSLNNMPAEINQQSQSNLPVESNPNSYQYTGTSAPKSGSPIIKEASKLPRVITANTLLNTSFPFALPVIDGVLQERQILLLTGPSKSGKSFLLLQLAQCLSAGKSFLNDFPCTAKKVLYVDLENGAGEMKSRLAAQCKALNWGAYATANLNFGFHNAFTQNISTFADGIINDAKSTGAEVIIIDPLYMLFNGEESSSAVATELVKNLKRIVSETNANLILCHHHTKGIGDKNVINRGSGSSVLGRFVDAAIDLSPIFKNVNLGNCSDDSKADPDECGAKVKANLGRYGKHAKVYTMAFSLRHYKTPADKTLVFDYPLFIEDPTILQKKKTASPKPTSEAVQNAFQMVMNNDGIVKVKTLADKLGISERRFRDLINTDLKDILSNNRGTLSLKEKTASA